MTPSWTSEFDHTGDVGFTVSAPDLETLFERAAWAMFNILMEPDAIDPVEEWPVEVEATDLDDLLLRWLSELNFLHVTERIVFNTFEIEELSDTSLKAVVRGEHIDETRHTIHTEIKAVTYHALTVERREEGWFARVIFDL
ncbi:MAG: archease [Rhodothermales bacterium]